MSRLVALAGRRFFRRHPWHLALALVGVALGVAVVAGVDLAGSAARKSFDQSLTAVVGSATHQILPAGGTLDEGFHVRLRREFGIDAATPVVEGRADATFGLATLASQYRLDFVAVIDERYDILVQRQAWFEPTWQSLVEFCRLPEFRRYAAELAGYDIDGQFCVHFNSGL